MQVRDLLGECAEHLRDPAMELVDANRLFLFLNSASRDARNEGWYVHVPQDSTIQFVQDTWDYIIPPQFIYINMLKQEDPQVPGLFNVPIWDHMWQIAWDVDPPIAGDGGQPTQRIRFHSVYMPITAGLHVKITGQKRPSNYTAFTDAIDGGMESFLRERIIAYAARFMARAGTELDEKYDKLADEALALSEKLLHSHPQQFRQRMNARYVLGR